MSTIYTRATKGSALTWTEGDANITNLNNDKIEDIVEDTTPQLGGNLDVNGNSIVSTSNADINITPNGTGRVVLSGQKFPAGSSAITGTVTDVDAVRNPNTLTLSNPSGVNNNAVITFTGTGVSSLGLSVGVDYKIWALVGGGAAELALNSGGGVISITDPGTITDVNYSVAGAGATNGQLLSYNSTGLQWVNAPSGGISSVSADTNPQLGGNLNVNSNNITNASGDNKVSISGIKYPNTNGSNGQYLQTDGTGNATWASVSGGAATLNELTDVVITAAATNDVLVFDGTNWVDTAASSLTVSAASTATTATGATNINISTTDGNTSDTAMYPVLVANSATGNQLPHTDTGLSYNASTNTLSATTFNGAFNGTATGATNINISTIDGNASETAIFPVFVSSAVTGNQLPHIDSSGISYNASTNALTATTFIGALNGAHNGTVGATTANTGAFTTLSASTSVSFSPSGAITLNPTTAGTINNMSIGATTASTGAFTTLTASSGINSTAIGATTRSTGAFTTLTADTTTLDDIRETVAALSYTATIAPNAADGSIRTITLTGNVTFNAFTTPVSGQTITLIITQDATGSRTLTSTMKFAGASKTLSTAAGSIDILTVSYIGTTYYASLSKGFA